MASRLFLVSELFDVYAAKQAGRMYVQGDCGVVVMRFLLVPNTAENGGGLYHHIDVVRHIDIHAAKNSCALDYLVFFKECLTQIDICTTEKSGGRSKIGRAHV